MNLRNPIAASISLLILSVVCIPVDSAETTKIVLVAGETAKVDKVGHHDYLAGCKCLEILLRQTDHVHIEQVTNGWPNDEAAFDDADAIVFYTDGGGKQAFLETPERLKKMQSLSDTGVGFTMLHQAVDFPPEHAQTAKGWLGGVYLASTGAPRGHWESNHVDFPSHPLTNGVQPWKINDGWLCGIQFVEGKLGVTPLVWSGKEYAGSRAGLEQDIVGWAYERNGKGRAFGFTGLDAHSAWSLPGLRQLMVNGVLWTAGIEIPSQGAACDISHEQLAEVLTPRTPKPTKGKASSKSTSPKIAVMETALGGRGDVQSIAAAKQAGYSAIQMHSGMPEAIRKKPIDPSVGLAIGSDPQRIASWAQAAKKHDVEIVSLCAGSLNRCEIWERDHEVAMRIAKQTIDACETLNVRTMLFPFFGPSNFQESDVAFQGVAKFMKELLPYARRKNVVIGIEAPVTTVRVMQLLKELEYPPNLKVYYDTGNLFEKEDIYKTIRQYGNEHFCEVHVKAASHAVAGKGKIDLAKLAAALDDASYDGWLVYEANRSGRDPVANRKSIEKILSLRNSLRN